VRVAFDPPHEIRDPVHGAIPVDAAELDIIDHPVVQRLRGIRQLGFSHLAFPGATHTRFLHSLGAMHLAGRAFDACFRDDPFPSTARRLALRRCVRMAALCHDLGHPPFSHAVEFALPPLDALALKPENGGGGGRRATHEDFTLLLVTASSLSDAFAASFDFTAAHVAALVSPQVQVEDDFFVESGCDLRGLLSQLISSELDVDRLDYLVRDSVFTGARYGEIDTAWLISHLTRHVDADDRVCLALDGRALHALDDFMIARFHMFVMVYFHQKSVAYEEMLKRSLATSRPDWTLPADAEAYARTDDAWLWDLVRRQDDPWARRLVGFDPYKVVFEAHGTAEQAALAQRTDLLERAGIDAIPRTERGVMQRPPKAGAPDLYVVDHPRGGQRQVLRLHDATRNFRRDQVTASVSRIYVPPADLARAREALHATWQPRPLLFGELSASDEVLI